MINKKNTQILLPPWRIKKKKPFKSTRKKIINREQVNEEKQNKQK